MWPIRPLLLAAACALGVSAPGVAQTAPPAAAAGPDLVFLSGVLPAPASRASGFAAQAESVLAQMSARLRAGGGDLTRVVSATVYLTRPDDLAALDAAWTQAWPSDPPARSVVIGRLTEPDAGLLVSAVAAAPGVARTAIRPASWPAPPGPFSYAVRAGDTLFVSGLRPVAPGSGGGAPGDIATQTTAVLSQARPILEAAGLAMTDLVHARVYITETADFQAMNAAYRPNFPVPPPTRATVRVGHVHAGDLIAVELIAMRGERTALTTPAADGSPGLANPNYSSAVRVGRWLFTAGMLGVLPGRPPEMAAQSAETLDRLERTIRFAGYSWADAVHGDVWVTDAGQARTAEAALRARTGGKPLSTMSVGTGLVVQDGIVEIMIISWK